MGFDDSAHPRDSDGKFIESGGQKLQAWGQHRLKMQKEGPTSRTEADETIPKVGDFMREVKKEAKESPGGFTVRPGYEKPTTGTIVSLPTSAGMNLQFNPGEKASRAVLRDWVKKARNYLRNHEDTYIGGWKNDAGKIYLDISERYSDHAKAMKLGKERNQEGVFRLDDFSFHPTGGTGA